MKISSVFITTFLISCLALMLAVMACHHSTDQRGPANPAELKEPLIKANQEVMRTESEQIDDFIDRYGWKMNETSTGLRYMIYQKGNGPQGATGRTARLEYTLTFLTGDTVYTSRKDGPIVFEIGKGGVVSGLEEAILLLHVGDRAKIIIPSHLAFGLIGDQDKINFKASLVYDIYFVSMN
jgi:FKBP-type peptidyl-prolyl cis-trans isomerase FkpA